MKISVLSLACVTMLAAYLSPPVAKAQVDPNVDPNAVDMTAVDATAVDTTGGVGGVAGGAVVGGGGRGGRGGRGGGAAVGGLGGGGVVQLAGGGGGRGGGGGGFGGGGGGFGGGGGGFGGGGGGGGGGGRNNLQNVLGSPDDEWAVLSPRVQKIITAQALVAGTATTGGGGGGGGGRGGRGGGGMTTVTTANPTTDPVAMALAELRAVLNQDVASDEQIKEKLTVLRAAMAKAKLELSLAQKELQSLVTLRQEAILITYGYLE